MNNFIKADMYMNTKMKSNYVLFTFCLATAIGIAYVMSEMNIGNFGPEVGVNISLMSDTILIPLFGGIIVGNIVADDFESKNIHSLVMAGKGRLRIVISKTISYAIILFIITLPYALVTIFASISDGSYASLNGIPSQFFNLMVDVSNAEKSFENILRCIGLNMLIIYLYIAKLSICIPVAFLSKKKIPVIVVGFITAFGFDIIGSLVKDVPIISSFIASLPYSLANDIVFTASNAELLKVFIGATQFIIIMVYMSYKAFRNADIK